MLHSMIAIQANINPMIIKTNVIKVNKVKFSLFIKLFV